MCCLIEEKMENEKKAGRQAGRQAPGGKEDTEQNLIAKIKQIFISA